VRLIYVHEAAILFFREMTKLRCGTGTQKITLYGVNWYSSRARPLLQGRAHRSDQLR
jgi:hypothetical protein